MPECQYRCRRDRLAPHYVSFHKLSEKQTQKLIPQNWMDPNNKNCPEIQCNFCNHSAHPILLRIHIFQTHMEEKNLNAASIDLIIEGKICL